MASPANPFPIDRRIGDNRGRSLIFRAQVGSTPVSLLSVISQAYPDLNFSKHIQNETVQRLYNAGWYHAAYYEPNREALWQAGMAKHPDFPNVRELGLPAELHPKMHIEDILRGVLDKIDACRVNHPWLHPPKIRSLPPRQGMVYHWGTWIVKSHDERSVPRGPRGYIDYSNIPGYPVASVPAQASQPSINTSKQFPTSDERGEARPSVYPGEPDASAVESRTNGKRHLPKGYSPDPDLEFEKMLPRVASPQPQPQHEFRRPNFSDSRRQPAPTNGKLQFRRGREKREPLPPNGMLLPGGRNAGLIHRIMADATFGINDAYSYYMNASQFKFERESLMHSAAQDLAMMSHAVDRYGEIREFAEANEVAWRSHRDAQRVKTAAAATAANSQASEPSPQRTVQADPKGKGKAKAVDAQQSEQAENRRGKPVISPRARDAVISRYFKGDSEALKEKLAIIEEHVELWRQASDQETKAKLEETIEELYEAADEQEVGDFNAFADAIGVDLAHVKHEELAAIQRQEARRTEREAAEREDAEPFRSGDAGQGVGGLQRFGEKRKSIEVAQDNQKGHNKRTKSNPAGDKPAKPMASLAPKRIRQAAPKGTEINKSLVVTLSVPKEELEKLAQRECKASAMAETGLPRGAKRKRGPQTPGEIVDNGEGPAPKTPKLILTMKSGSKAAAVTRELPPGTTITFEDGTTYTDPGPGHRQTPHYVSSRNDQSKGWVVSAHVAVRNGTLLDRPCKLASDTMRKEGRWEPTFWGFKEKWKKEGKTTVKGDDGKSVKYVSDEHTVKCSFCQSGSKGGKICTSVQMLDGVPELA